MSPVVWIIIWGFVLVGFAALYFREWRSGRKGVDFDPYAPRGEADSEMRMRGDGNRNGQFGGGAGF